MRGKLLTGDFLDVGIGETRAWKALDPGEVDRFRANLRSVFEAFPVSGAPWFHRALHTGWGGPGLAPPAPARVA